MSKAALSALLPFLLAACRPAVADDSVLSPRVSTAAAEVRIEPAGPLPHEAGIRSLMGRLSALLEKGREVDRQALDAAAAEIAALDLRLTALLGPAILRELDLRDKEKNSARALMEIRTGLLAYYGANEGAYPASLETLVPKYLPAIPKAELPEHAAADSVLLHTDKNGGPAEAVTDAGGWLYFSDHGSRHYGLVILNCSHKDSTGSEYYKY